MLEQTRPRVLALVLTHNAPETLRACVTRVLEQLKPGDKLTVVDNASDPPAMATVAPIGARAAVEVVRLDRNLGPAGGYARGLRHFLESDQPFVWIVDDDMMPESGALSRLMDLSLAQPDPVLVFPRVQDRQGRPFDVPAWCGVLIPRTIVEHVGMPREEYFWWCEDCEYLAWRIPRAGYRTMRAPDAQIVHEAVRRGRHKPAWKFYYEIRNVVHYRLNVQVPAGVSSWRCTRKLLRSLARMTAGILIREDHKVRKLMALAHGLNDGIAGRLGIRTDMRVGLECSRRL